MDADLVTTFRDVASSNEPEPAIDRLLSLREVCLLTSLSRTSIYRKIAAGSFPEQIQISEGRVAWSAHDIQRWRQKCRQMPAEPKALVEMRASA